MALIILGLADGQHKTDDAGQMFWYNNYSLQFSGMSGKE